MNQSLKEGVGRTNRWLVKRESLFSSSLWKQYLVLYLWLKSSHVYYYPVCSGIFSLIQVRNRMFRLTVSTLKCASVPPLDIHHWYLYIKALFQLLTSSWVSVLPNVCVSPAVLSLISFSDDEEGYFHHNDLKHES